MSFCLRYSVALGDPAQPDLEPTENSMNGGHGNYYLLPARYLRAAIAFVVSLPQR
jgi:hypothetical protein